MRKYKQDGIDGLVSRTWKKHNQKLKEQTVLDYLNGLGSLDNIIEKYHISDKSILKR
ncbi:hypothetical protein [Streptococcus periodonticum]|uniref:hypothetical protein n=1 Tax=Streptococcus periodonticum TaxID=2490633 RepID=UPI0013A628B1|nr:hypothetical protein [Streptococcus periodonticum]